MIGRAARVGVMLDDFEFSPVTGQSVEDIGCLMRCGQNHIDVVGCALIGYMGIEAKPMIDAIAGVDVAARCASFCSPEELAIGTGRGAITPDPREWQVMMGIDEDR